MELSIDFGEYNYYANTLFAFIIVSFISHCGFRVQ